MGKTGFEKATSKMFGSFGSSVKVAEPGTGERLSKEERDRMRRLEEEKERSVELEQREKDRRQLVQDLVDMNVISKEEAKDKVEEQQPEVVEEKGQGRGRPPKNPEGGERVLMNFRVTPQFRSKLKVMAAELDCSVVDLFEEAFQLLSDKRGFKLQD